MRGKADSPTEFGAKLSVSLVNGYAFLDRLSWDAFNEGTDLSMQVERYRDRFGYYPETVIADTIYGTRENRRFLKSLDIEFSGKALGRPPKLPPQEAKLLRQQRKAQHRLRNQIKGKFGEGKRRYDLDLVKAKTMSTSESWIAAVFFVMNLARWQRMASFLSLCRWLKNFKERLFSGPQMAFNCNI